MKRVLIKIKNINRYLSLSLIRKNNAMGLLNRNGINFAGSILIPLFGLMMGSCVKTEIQNISENTTLVQDFSVPLIAKELAIHAPNTNDASSVPGTYGSFFYNGLQYPNNYQAFKQNFFVGFNLDDSKGRASMITYLKFHILIENNFPTKIYTQVLLYNSNYTYSDSLFVNGPLEVEAATVDANGLVLTPGVKLVDIPFEGKKLDQLKTVNYLFDRSTIMTQNADKTPIKLTDKNVIKINIATHIQLDYNIKDMFN
jgi:hypothetical protein